MKIRIKETASKEYLASKRKKMQRGGLDDSERARVALLEQNEGRVLEVDTKYLFDNQFNTKPGEGSDNGMRVMMASVAEVIDDERPNRKKCEHCGSYYVLADEKVPHDHCRNCYAGRPDKLVVCRTVRTGNYNHISWVESKRRTQPDPATIEYRYRGDEQARVDEAVLGEVAGQRIVIIGKRNELPQSITADVETNPYMPGVTERLTFSRVPTSWLRGKPSDTFHLLALDSRGYEWAVVESSTYPATKGHYFMMSGKYSE